MQVLMLSLKSLYNRRLTAWLTLVSIALSVTLLLGVERIREGAQESFENTLSGTDLLVGGRTGPVQLLLYSVFRIGNATNNISWESYQNFLKQEDVKWTIPISLGDSHRGYRVVGTDQNYFKHYRYGRDRSLTFSEGEPFSDLYDAVLGYEVAQSLGYPLGEKIILSHGIEETSFQDHEDKPFQVVGILARTGTPVDRSVYVSLEGVEAIHVDWQDGAPPSKDAAISAEEVRRMALQPKQITAFLVGLRSKIGIFSLQREINEYIEEPLLAVLPGATFQELWGTLSIVELALRAISIFVILTGLFGMLTSILMSLNERRREMAILRSVGAKPHHIFLLLLSESGVLTALGCLLGFLLVNVTLLIMQPIIEQQVGLYIPIRALSFYEIIIILGVVGAGVLMGCVPAWRAYRRSLADGLTIRV